MEFEPSQIFQGLLGWTRLWCGSITHLFLIVVPWTLLPYGNYTRNKFVVVFFNPNLILYLHLMQAVRVEPLIKYGMVFLWTWYYGNIMGNPWKIMMAIAIFWEALKSRWEPFNNKFFEWWSYLQNNELQWACVCLVRKCISLMVMIWCDLILFWDNFGIMST